MERNGNGVSALLGLDGFVVCAQLLDEKTGEWWLAVETTEDRGWCAACRVRAVGHGRRRVKVRDLPMADRPVVLVWAKRLWRCGEPACAMGTWSEESDEIATRAVLTERARAEIARRVGVAPSTGRLTAAHGADCSLTSNSHPHRSIMRTDPEPVTPRSRRAQAGRRPSSAGATGAPEP